MNDEGHPACPHHLHGGEDEMETTSGLGWMLPWWSLFQYTPRYTTVSELSSQVVQNYYLNDTCVLLLDDEDELCAATATGSKFSFVEKYVLTI